MRSGVHIKRYQPEPNKLITVRQFGDTAGGAIEVISSNGAEGLPAAVGEEIVTFLVFAIDAPKEPTRTVVLKVNVVHC